METTFITIHDLSEDARVLYSSDSIVDILGHTPDEVLGKSCWDFFHPDEVPIAKQFHSRGVRLDKAAVLAYCNVRNRRSEWVCCECCFSIVYNVMVVCTSIYRRGISSQQRAVQAPIVRKLFSSSPNDPRYHMLAHLSKRFSQGPKNQTHEPRAALFLNRFTRTLTIMYATQGIEEILGIPSESIMGKSFYYCIQDQCQQDAIRCIESAKGNDSLAYLRFKFQDPRRFDHPAHDDTTEDDTETDVSMTDLSDDEDPSGSDVQRSSNEPASLNGEYGPGTMPQNGYAAASTGQGEPPSLPVPTPTPNADSRTSSDNSTAPRDTSEAIFDFQAHAHRSNSGNSPPDSPNSSTPSQGNNEVANDVELEAVVSCASDGLVVCLRRARPAVPEVVQRKPVHSAVPPPPAHPAMFAAPWAVDPVFTPQVPPGYAYYPQRPQPAGAYSGPGFPPRLSGPSQDQIFDAISDVAVFAWALTGINGTLAEFGHGTPTGEAQPASGLPIWEGAKNAYDDFPRHASTGPGNFSYPTPYSRDNSGNRSG